MDDFLRGMIAMASVVAGLFFLRFWRGTRDRFFLAFALAFWMLGLVRLALVLTQETSEPRTYLYLVRFVAFLLIIFAIIDKNRAGSPRKRQEAPVASEDTASP